MFVAKYYQNKIYSVVKFFFVSVILLTYYLNPTLLLDFVIVHIVSHPPDSLSLCLCFQFTSNNSTIPLPCFQSLSEMNWLPISE